MPLDPEHVATPEQFSLVVKKSPARGFDARFVLSAGSPDRVKDTIDPAAYLPNVGKRLVALLGHERNSVVGYWENLKVEGDALVADIKLVSTQLGQLVKTWLAEGVPLFASIGFRGKGEPNDIGGIHYTRLELLETSVVTVPAHPRAQQIAKQLGITLPSGDGQLPAYASAAASPSSAAAAARSSHRSNVMSKTISELVTDTQTAHVAARDKLTEETQKLGALDTASDEYAAQKVVVDELTAQTQALEGKLASLKSAEARLAASAGASQSAAVIQQRSSTKDVENLLGKLALCVYESRIKSTAIDVVAAQRFPGSQAVETIVKAAQNPAMSNVAGYAQELTRIAYGQFLDLLRSAAILPQCTPAANSHSFDGASSIYIPTRLGGAVAGAFRAEGAPIPVKGLTFSSQTLTPKNMGVIVTATAEMLRRSSINLAAYFQSTIIYDTGKALDALFVSTTAGSAIAPAGARNALNAADTRVSTGATAAQITNDLKLMLKGLTNNDMGSPATTKWLMHPSNMVAVSMLLTATGSKQFPETEGGRLAGYPVVTSTRMPADIVLLIDFENFTFALGSPQFDATTVATIHEEDTTPLAIGTPGAPASVAAPARSLFQTNSWALRLLLDADWKKLRPIGPVQELTAVAW